MDRHDVSEEVTAEHVAQLHQEDLKIQHTFNCKGLTYWFDDSRKTAFCLVEAPDKDAIKRMHDKAHGQVPHHIIEVDNAVVESFLGRIEDPEKSKNTELNIINDPAFRTIMATSIIPKTLLHTTTEEFRASIQASNERIINTIHFYKGRLVKQKPYYFLSSFDSVTNAVVCAKTIQVNHDALPSDFMLKTGLSAGVPVTEKEGLFEDTIKMADRLCKAVKGSINISGDVRDLYESENRNSPIDPKIFRSLERDEEHFLELLMDYTDKEWRNTGLNVNDISRRLGFSKTQLYRKMILVTGRSPHNFMMEYRLIKALALLKQKHKNISEIAFETGFNSPAYFSKCFERLFSVLPSVYIRQNSGS